ncbi:hypothetical protein PIB30_073124 [Stylosanthes scabra]|uniref:Disease resistance protein At4g27190-like leucine-rich repeats domain-containing protein n=1 Tax=Stylosanthes scabra TaxID=79078 RepID=A0ABU6RP66_9FABA|nr:hypothetical protein [Stylosanthes scabra]
MGSILESFASEFISKLGDLVVNYTVKQFQYLICHEKLVGNLRKEHEKLKGMKEALKGKVEADRSSGLQIADNVQQWLSDVEAIDADVQKLLDDAEQNKHKKCMILILRGLESQPPDMRRMQDIAHEMAGSETVNIKHIAREVAKECGGLPLAIVTVGSGLRNKAKTQWQNALNQQRHSKLQDKVHSSVELSIRALGNEEYKYFLFLCALFPEDFDVPIEGVLRRVLGMQLIEFIGALVNPRNKVDDLKRCFLLLESRERGCVKMHDIQGCDELKQLKKQDKAVHFRALSLILQDAITDGKEFQNGLRCPKLELFQARSEIGEAILWPEDFLQGMSKIRVLTMNKLNIPVIFCGSNIKELPAEIGQLSSLKLLDLTGCDQLNESVLGELIELCQHLKVFEIQVREAEILPKDLSFNNLERFWIYVASHIHRDDYRRVGYVEPNTLVFEDTSYNKCMKGSSVVMQLIRRCEVLKIVDVKKLKNCLPAIEFIVDIGPPKAKGDIGFSIAIDSSEASSSSLDSSHHVRSCHSLEEVFDMQEYSKSSNSQMFPHLRDITIEFLPKLKYVWGNVPRIVDGFHNLKSIDILGCHSLRHVFTPATVRAMVNLETEASLAQHQQLAISEIKGKAEISHAPILEYLGLEDCDSVEEVVLLEETHDSSVDIFNNDNIEKRTSMLAFTHLNWIDYQSLRIFVLLQSRSKMAGVLMKNLEVSYCKNIEEIVSKEKINTSADQVMFPKLETLNLESLPKLRAFCVASYAFEFPSLRKVNIEDCMNMEVFSGGSCRTTKLDYVTMNSKATNSGCDIFVQKRDLNATVEGFKAFMAL